MSAVVGSASMPFIFPPRDMSKHGMKALLLDGGTSWNNNMMSGIQECLKLEGIYSLSQVEVDVISLDAVYLSTFDPDSEPEFAEFQDIGNPYLETKTLKNYWRSKAIQSYYKGQQDIIEFMDLYPEVNYRYFVQPVQSLMAEYKILEFKPEVAEQLIQLGKEATQKSIDMGPGKSFEALRKR